MQSGDSGGHLRCRHGRQGVLVDGLARHDAYHATNDEAFPGGAAEMTSRAKWLLISMFCSAVLAGGTAWFVTDWALHRHGESHAHDQTEPDFHAWKPLR